MVKLGQMAEVMWRPTTDVAVRGICRARMLPWDVCGLATDVADDGRCGRRRLRRTEIPTKRTTDTAPANFNKEIECSAEIGRKGLADFSCDMKESNIGKRV